MSTTTAPPMVKVRVQVTEGYIIHYADQEYAGGAQLDIDERMLGFLVASGAIVRV